MPNEIEECDGGQQVTYEQEVSDSSGEAKTDDSVICFPREGGVEILDGDPKGPEAPSWVG